MKADRQIFKHISLAHIKKKVTLKYIGNLNIEMYSLKQLFPKC